MQAALDAQPNLTIREGTVEDLALDASAQGRPCVRGVLLGGRDADSGTAGCAHHRHIPAWPHPYRGAADPGGPRRRRAVDGPCAHFGTARLPPRPAEDRHPAKARRPHHRLGRAGSAGGRRAARALLLSYRCDHAGAGGLPHHRHGACKPRPHSPQSRALTHLFRCDREPGPPLLPLDRGQGGALRGPLLSPDFP